MNGLEGEERERKNRSIEKETALCLIDLFFFTQPRPPRPISSSLPTRSFCSKKLRRLSCSLKLNALTQRGKFVKRQVEPEATTEVG